MLGSIRFSGAWVYSIQSGTNLQYIPTPSSLRIKWIITIYKEEKNINQVRNQEKLNVKIYYSTTGYENMLSHFV